MIADFDKIFKYGLPPLTEEIVRTVFIYEIIYFS